MGIRSHQLTATGTAPVASSTADVQKQAATPAAERPQISAEFAPGMVNPGGTPPAAIPTDPGGAPVGQGVTDPVGPEQTAGKSNMDAFQTSLSAENPAMAEIEKLFQDYIGDQSSSFKQEQDVLRQDQAYEKNKALSMSGKLGGGVGSSFLAGTRQAQIQGQQQMQSMMLDQGDRQRQVQMAMLDNQINTMNQDQGRKWQLEDEQRNRQFFEGDRDLSRSQQLEDRDWGAQREMENQLVSTIASGDPEQVAMMIDSMAAMGREVPPELLALSENLGMGSQPGSTPAADGGRPSDAQFGDDGTPIGEASAIPGEQYRPDDKTMSFDEFLKDYDPATGKQKNIFSGKSYLDSLSYADLEAIKNNKSGFKDPAEAELQQTLLEMEKQGVSIVKKLPTKAEDQGVAASERAAQTDQTAAARQSPENLRAQMEKSLSAWKFMSKAQQDAIINSQLK